MALEPVAQQYGKLYAQAAEAAKQLYSVVTGLISKLLDVLIMVNLASAAGTATIETGIGALAGYGVAAYYAWQAYDLYKEISTFYSNAEATFKGIAGTIAAVKAGHEVAAIPSLTPYRHPASY
jgi:sensor histidine kinase regulating citrate/malate metabolism